jgi:hypothetical protein
MKMEVPMRNKTLCVKCGLYVCVPCVPEAANDNHFVQLLNDEELRSPDVVNGLAKECAALGISSRQLPTEMAKTIFEYRGAVLNHLGKPFVIGVNDIDNAFRVAAKRVDDNEEDALDWVPDFRWVRFFYKKAHTPGKQTAQMRVTDRLRLIYIFVAIKNQQNELKNPVGGRQS